MITKEMINDLAARLKGAAVMIDDRDNVIVRGTNLDDNFFDIWDNLTNEEHFEVISNRFTNIHSIHFKNANIRRN